MKKISKKVIRLTIINAVDQALSDSGIISMSKKTQKAIVKASGKISEKAQQDLKKQGEEQVDKKKSKKVKIRKIKISKKLPKKSAGSSDDKKTH